MNQNPERTHKRGRHTLYLKKPSYTLIVSKEHTYELIEKYPGSGLDVEAIIYEYENMYLSTHNGIVDGHIRDLLQEGCIYHTNLDHQRGIEYKFKVA